MKRRAKALKSRVAAAGVAGRLEQPKPGMSQATTRWLFENAANCGSHDAEFPPSPCRNTIGGPLPASR